MPVHSARTMDVGAPSDANGDLAEQALITKPRRPRPLRVREAFLHLFKGNVGPGVLALPLHFARIGPVYGTIVMVIIATQGIYGMWVLVRAQQLAAKLSSHQPPSTARLQQQQQQRPLCFEGVGNAAFGPSGRRLVASCVLCLQLGVCAVIIGLLTTNLHAEFSDKLSRHMAVLIAYVPCVLLAQLPDLTALWPLSLFGNMAMLLALGSSVVASGFKLAHAPPQLTRRTVSYSNVVSCISSSFYAFEGVALVLPVGNQLSSQDRSRYPWILVSAMGVVAACFVIVGASGGAAFSHEDSASITSFLERRFHGTPLSPYFHFVNLAVASAVLATFPLQLTPAAQVIDRGLGLESQSSQRIARFIAVTACASLVAVVDTLDVLIDLIGGITNTMLASLPFLLHFGLLLSLRRVEGQPVEAQDMAVLALDGAGFLLCMATLVLTLTVSVF